RAVGEVDSAVRQTDVVDDARQLTSGNQSPDFVFDAVGERGGFFDPRAARCPQVQLELAAVDLRKEVLANPSRENQRGRASGEKDREEQAPMGDPLRQRGSIGVPERDEASVDPPLGAREDAYAFRVGVSVS